LLFKYLLSWLLWNINIIFSSSSLPVEALAEGVPVMLTLLDHFYKIKIFYLFYKLGSIPLCSDYIFLEVNAIKTLALHL